MIVWYNTVMKETEEITVLMSREEVAKAIAENIENYLRKLFPEECSKRDEKKEKEKTK